MIFKEERDKISDYFNNQEGQNYPCSNQVVICGFVTDDDNKWEEFIRQNENNIVTLMKRKVRFENGERWVRIPTSESSRGYRYYKVKVDNNINRKFLEQIILPCCAHYCCEFEWI
jgi:hypothetical protein